MVGDDMVPNKVREEAPNYQADSNRKLTYKDYLELPEDPGFRFEILDGVLIKDPSPSTLHQRAVGQILHILSDHFWEVDPEGEVFIAPLDTTLGDFTVVQPDVLYVSGEQKEILKEARIDGAPALAVEVISPFSIQKDTIQKLRIYQEAGVQHYWLVNPEEQTLQCFSLREGAYALVAVGMDNEIVEPPGFPGLVIPLKALWHNVRPEGL